MSQSKLLHHVAFVHGVLSHSIEITNTDIIGTLAPYNGSIYDFLPEGLTRLSPLTKADAETTQKQLTGCIYGDRTQGDKGGV